MAGLVLCGGASRRMGAEKALLAFEGEALVARVARRLSSVASPVILAPGTRGRLGDLGFEEVDDVAEGSGPLAGLAAGLSVSPHPLVAVVAVDMPFASPEVLTLLARRIGTADAAIPVTDEGSQPLHAVYSTRALPAIRHALRSGRRAVREVVSDVLRARWVERDAWRTGDPTGTFAMNLNRPEDWTSMEALGTEASVRTAIDEKEERDERR